MTTRTVRVLISGRVQGVWFRGWTAQEATRLALSGWVRNLKDGRVEALFSGAEEDVERILELCRQGPRMATVTDVVTEPAEPPAEQGFHNVRGD